MGRQVCLTMPLMDYVLSFIKIRDQPLGRQVCLTMPKLCLPKTNTLQKTSSDSALKRNRSNLRLSCATA